MRNAIISSMIFLTSASAWAETGGAPANVSDEQLVQAAEKLVADAKLVSVEDPVASKNEVAPATTATVTMEAVDTAEVMAEATSDEAIQKAATPQKESEIPVIYKTKETKETKSQSVIWRLVASFAILTIVGAGMIFASKRWTKRKDTVAQGARIEFMHQHHLGPKRSLALIRVAGETMIIGITDAHINLIKTITIIDTEMENAFVAPDFNHFLDEEEFSIEDVKSAIKARA